MPIWVEVFVKMAVGQADTQERHAQRAQYLAWMTWLQEGPAAGLRRQHQFTKVKTGWVESALLQETGNDDEATCVEDGVSLQQLATAVQPPDVVMHRPASMQEELIFKRRHGTASGAAT